MFQCAVCGDTTFQLMLHPACEQLVKVVTTDASDVLIHVGERVFTADLAFMNRYAICPCGEKKQWSYFYPDVKVEI